MKAKLTLAILATLGILDTFYLALEHFRNIVPPCPVQPTLLIDCGAVLHSQYSIVFGIPLALFGLGYYLVLLTLVFLSLQTKKKLYLRLLLPFSLAGLGTSIALLYLQLFIIKSICLYCTASGLINLIVFLLIFFTSLRRVEFTKPANSGLNNK